MADQSRTTRRADPSVRRFQLIEARLHNVKLIALHLLGESVEKPSVPNPALSQNLAEQFFALGKALNAFSQATLLGPDN